MKKWSILALVYQKITKNYEFDHKKPKLGFIFRLNRGNMISSPVTILESRSNIANARLHTKSISRVFESNKDRALKTNFSGFEL